VRRKKLVISVIVMAASLYLSSCSKDSNPTRINVSHDENFHVQGDMNGDRRVTQEDARLLFNYLFRGKEKAPDCPGAMNMDGNFKKNGRHKFSITDVVLILEQASTGNEPEYIATNCMYAKVQSGDINFDGLVDITDIYHLGTMVLGREDPEKFACPAAGNIIVDWDPLSLEHTINEEDLNALKKYLFGDPESQFEGPLRMWNPMLCYQAVIDEDDPNPRFDRILRESQLD